LPNATIDPAATVLRIARRVIAGEIVCFWNTSAISCLQFQRPSEAERFKEHPVVERMPYLNNWRAEII